MGAYDLLSVTRIDSLWDETADIRELQQDFRWSDEASGRIPWKNATWGEIAARISKRVTIAPFVGYGMAAQMKTPNVSVRLEQSTIPKIKHGMPITEENLIALRRVQRAISNGYAEVEATQEDMDVFTNWELEQLEDLDEGCRARAEHFAIGMLCNRYTYANEHGMMFDMTWGTPSELSVTPAILWGDGTMGMTHGNASATPISDMQILQVNIENKYGFWFNRASMSLQALQYIFFTTEFRGLVPLYATMMGISPANPNLPYNDVKFMKSILENMWSMTIETDDRVVMVENNALSNWIPPPNTPATDQFIRYHPVNKVILTNTSSDKNRRDWDMGNAPVMEATGLVPNMIGDPSSMGSEDSGNVYGPFSYATAADPNGDPPGLYLWSTLSILPRKKRLTVSAVLTVF